MAPTGSRSTRALERLGGGPGEGTVAGQRLDEHQAERVDVGGRAGLCAVCLLRAQVGGRADHHAVAGDPLRPHQVGDAEVGELAAVRQSTAGR